MSVDNATTSRSDNMSQPEGGGSTPSAADAKPGTSSAMPFDLVMNREEFNAMFDDARGVPFTAYNLLVFALIGMGKEKVVVSPVSRLHAMLMSVGHTQTLDLLSRFDVARSGGRKDWRAYVSVLSSYLPVVAGAYVVASTDANTQFGYIRAWADRFLVGEHAGLRAAFDALDTHGRAGTIDSLYSGSAEAASP